MGTKDFDHRADIYSLGCTLYFLLTGRPPFLEGMLHEKLMKHQAMQPEPITKFRSDVLQDLVDVCGKMMAKAPDERYQSAEALSETLAKFPAPKRRAKPAARPLKTAEVLPDTEEDQGLRIDVGEEDSLVMTRRKTRAGAAAAGSKFLKTPKQKIIAGSVTAGALILLLVILIPLMRGSGSKEEVKKGDWLEVEDRPIDSTKKERKLELDLAETEQHSLVFDFETGDLQGWKVVKGKFDCIVSEGTALASAPGESFNKQGQYHLTTVATGSGETGNEGMTGVIESPVFVLSKEKISMLVGGGSGGKTYVALLHVDGTEVGRIDGKDSETMERIEWSVPQLLGKPGFLRVVDWSKNEHGHITFDNFQADGHIDQAATEERFAKALAPPPKAKPAVPGPIAVQMHDFNTGGRKHNDMTTVAGWESEGGAGIETNQAGFIAPGGKIFQTLDHQIVADGTYSLRFDAARGWLNAHDQVIQGGFYYRSDDGALAELAATPEIILEKAWKNGMLLKFTAAAGKPYIGKNLIVLFANPSDKPDRFPHVDNVRVDYAAAAGPEKVATADTIKAVPSKEDPGEPPPDAEQPKAPVEGNLVFYNMDEESDKIIDQSDTGHHGEIRGNVVYNQPGKHDGALLFNGGRVVVEKSNTFDHTADFTWTAWIKTNADGYIFWFSADNRWARGGKSFEVRGGKLCLHVNSVGYFHSKKRVNDDQWHHVAVTVEANANGNQDKCTLYVDGKLDSVQGWNIDIAPEKNFLLQIGGSFRGLIDGVTVWNRALELEEIVATAKPYSTAFRNLAKTGNLAPVKGETQPTKHPLGELVLKANQTVNLQLLGSEQAINLPRRFTMAYDEEKKFYVIKLIDEKRADVPPVSVAAIAVQDGKLLFRWAPGVAAVRANALLNCGLEISVDGRSRFLPLGWVQHVEPLVLNFDRPARIAIPDDRLPTIESLRLRIERLDGGLPNPQFNPGKILTAGSRVEIKFDEKVFPDFRLQVAFNARTHPSVDVTTGINYKWQNMITPRVFKAKEAGTVMQSMVAHQSKLKMDLQMTAPGNNRRKNDIKKKLDPVEEKIRKFTLLQELYTRSRKEPVKLHFSIFSVVDDERRIPVITSLPPEPAEPEDADSPKP